VALDKKRIEQALKNVKDVLGDGDIVAENRVEKISIEGGSVMITLNLPTEDEDIKRRVEDQCRAAIKAFDESAGVMIVTKGPSAQQAEKKPAGPRAGGDPWEDRAPLPGVKHIIAVSSAKGGVGKSTVCVNLALALRKRGAKVGIMDADVYGPSIHLLLDVYGPPQPGKNREVAPVEKSGLKLMSLGFLTDRGTPVIWRGPMVMGVVKKFLQDVDWGDLDYLMIDMPPGTGDAQLTLVQTVPITGAIIVTTSSELALVDAEKGLVMFRSVNAPVLGMIENMSYYVCPHCNERTDIFGHGLSREVCRRLETEFLGELPLDPTVRAGGDRGKPIVTEEPDSPVSQAFLAIADRIREMHPAG
jgi:ATP-binding protein involved in chromosome partitioning